MATNNGGPPSEGPPSSEDSVECRLYSVISQENDTEQDLCIKAMKYSQFLKELTCNYIWYHEELRIFVSRELHLSVGRQLGESHMQFKTGVIESFNMHHLNF